MLSTVNPKCRHLLRLFNKIDHTLLCVYHQARWSVEQMWSMALQQFHQTGGSAFLRLKALRPDHLFIDVHGTIGISASKGQQTNPEIFVQFHLFHLFPSLCACTAEAALVQHRLFLWEKPHTREPSSHCHSTMFKAHVLVESSFLSAMCSPYIWETERTTMYCSSYEL